MLTILSALTSLYAKECPPDLAAPCYSAPEPECDLCLGPNNFAASAAVGPATCNGDFLVILEGLYWKACQEGLEYAIQTQVMGTDIMSLNPTLNNLIDAHYISPDFGWDFGFRLGAGYVSTCDGWDVNLLWTRYTNCATTETDSSEDENIALLPIWSAFQFPHAATTPVLFANSIESFWNLRLNLVDVELGRAFWNSRKLSLRPFIGVRVGSINQWLKIEPRGGTWNDPNFTINLRGETHLHSAFRGAGLRAGLGSLWYFARGFSLYGNSAYSLLYGRFDVTQDEFLKEVTPPFGKIPVLESKNSTRAVRGIWDLGLGIEWDTMFCNCRYGLTVALGWEQRLFFNQNQFFQVNRMGGTDQVIPNNTGENSFIQPSGDLSTAGFTLSATFAF